MPWRGFTYIYVGSFWPLHRLPQYRAGPNWALRAAMEGSDRL